MRLGQAIKEVFSCPLDFPEACQYVTPGLLGEFAEESLANPKSNRYPGAQDVISRCAPCREFYNTVRLDMSQNDGKI